MSTGLALIILADSEATQNDRRVAVAVLRQRVRFLGLPNAARHSGSDDERDQGGRFRQGWPPGLS